MWKQPERLGRLERLSRPQGLYDGFRRSNRLTLKDRRFKDDGAPAPSSAKNRRLAREKSPFDGNRRQRASDSTNSQGRRKQLRRPFLQTISGIAGGSSGVGCWIPCGSDGAGCEFNFDSFYAQTH